MQQQLRARGSPARAPAPPSERQARTSDDRRRAAELLETPGALLTRSHLRELGLERRAIDAVFRALPVVALPGYSRPMIRAEEYLELVERAHLPRRPRPAAAVPSVWIERREIGGRRRTLSRQVPARRPRKRTPLRGLVRDQAGRARSPDAGSPASSPRCACRASGDSRRLPLRHRHSPRLPNGGAPRGSTSPRGPPSAIASNSRASCRVLGTRRVDEITPADVAELVAALHAAGRKRETIRKSLTVLAQVLDFAGIKDNPARDRIHVRLPREEREEPNPADRRPDRGRPAA